MPPGLIASLSSFLFTDSENPQEAGFKPLSKNLSASTVISNLSLKSGSVGSDLDARFKDADSAETGSSAGTSMRSKGSLRSDSQPNLRDSRYLSRDSLLDLSRVTSRDDTRGSSRDFAAPSRGGVVSTDKRVPRSYHRSEPSLGPRLRTPTNGSVLPEVGNVKHLSSVPRDYPVISVVDHSRTPSLPEHASDSSVDSYSDIVGQRPPYGRPDEPTSESVPKVTQTKPSRGHMSASTPSLTRVNDREPVSRTPTNVIAQYPQGRSILKNSLTKNQNSVINPRYKYRSEENLKAQNTPHLANGDVPRGRGKERIRAVSGGATVDGTRRGQIRSKSVPRAAVNSVSSDEETEEFVTRQRQRGRTLNRNLNASVERVHSPPGRVTGRPLSYHGEQLPSQMEQHGLSTMNGIHRNHSPQSSIESTDSPRTRQSVAERAATVLMQNHVPHVSTPLSQFEMKSLGEERRKLKKEHLANLSHLQSSSC